MRTICYDPKNKSYDPSGLLAHGAMTPDNIDDYQESTNLLTPSIGVKLLRVI
jgi:hypothetical protein